MNKKTENNALLNIKETTNQIQDIINKELNVLKSTITFNITKFKDEENIEFEVLFRTAVKENTSKLSQETISKIKNIIDNVEEYGTRYRIDITNDSYSTYCKMLESKNYEKQSEDIKVFKIYYHSMSELKQTGFSPSFYAEVNSKEFNENSRKQYFNIVNGLHDIFNNKLDKSLCYIQSLNLEFYALMWSNTSQGPEMQNILQQYYIEKTIADLYRNKVRDKSEIKKEINSAFMHEFWSRYQYEIDVTEKGAEREGKTIDVYTQLKPSLNLITDYIYNKLYES